MNFPTNKQFEVRNPGYLEFKPFHDEGLLKEILAPILEFSTESRMRIIDCMCGTGIVGKYLQRKLGEQKIESLIFTDGSSKMLSALNTGCEKVEALADKLPFPDDNFDVMTCRAGFNNLEKDEYEKVIKEFLRILKPNGLLIVQDHFPIDEIQKTTINSLEKLVAQIDGRDDLPYIPSVMEFQEMVILAGGGKVLEVVKFEKAFDFRERLLKKEHGMERFGDIENFLAYHAGLEFSDEGKKFLVTYPFATFTISKQKKQK